MRRITNYVGAGIGLVLSIGYYFIIRNMNALSYTDGFAGIFSAVVIILAFTAGSQLCTWLGNQIDSKGIGNGLSLLIFAGIVARWSSVYSAVTNIVGRAQNGEPQFYAFLPLLVVLALVAIVFVVILTNAERRIPVQYAKRVVGRKMYGGQNSYIPIKINMSGVMPIIFASTLCGIPSLIGGFLPLEQGSFWYVFSTPSTTPAGCTLWCICCLSLRSTTSTLPSSTIRLTLRTSCARITAPSRAFVPASPPVTSL